MTIALATFAAILGIVLVPYWALVLRPEQGATRTIMRRIKIKQALAPAGRPELLQAERPLSSVFLVQRLLARLHVLTVPIQRQLAQSGLSLSVGVVVLTTAFVGLLAFAAAFFLTGMVLVSAILGVMAAVLPAAALKVKATARLRKFEGQLPETVELIARALRAGHAFTTGLAMVADEIPDPAGAEFRLVHDRQNFGMPLNDALRDLAQRVPVLDVRFFVTAVLTQRESGGNLAEVLDGLAVLMRERLKLKRQVRTLSAHGRITGWVLFALAPTIATILTLIAPAHMSLLLTDPLGRAMVGAVLVLQVIGIFAIRRIIDIEV